MDLAAVTDGLSIERKVNLLALGNKPVPLLTTGKLLASGYCAALSHRFLFFFLFHPHSQWPLLSHNLPSKAGLLGGNI